MGSINPNNHQPTVVLMVDLSWSTTVDGHGIWKWHRNGIWIGGDNLIYPIRCTWKSNLVGKSSVELGEFAWWPDRHGGKHLSSPGGKHRKKTQVAVWFQQTSLRKCLQMVGNWCAYLWLCVYIYIIMYVCVCICVYIYIHIYVHPQWTYSYVSFLWPQPSFVVQHGECSINRTWCFHDQIGQQHRLRIE